MRIDAPEIYFGKKIKITSVDGHVTIGELYGFDYDVDDDDNDFLEFDVETKYGLVVTFTEDEIESIEVLNEHE